MLTCIFSFPGLRVLVENEDIQEWTFGPNNTLTFKSQQGFDGWLQFVHLPGSPIVVGKIREFEGNNVNSKLSAFTLCLESFIILDSALYAYPLYQRQSLKALILQATCP